MTKYVLTLSGLQDGCRKRAFSVATFDAALATARREGRNGEEAEIKAPGMILPFSYRVVGGRLRPMLAKWGIGAGGHQMLRQP